MRWVREGKGISRDVLPYSPPPKFAISFRGSDHCNLGVGRCNSGELHAPPGGWLLQRELDTLLLTFPSQSYIRDFFPVQLTRELLTIRKTQKMEDLASLIYKCIGQAANILQRTVVRKSSQNPTQVYLPELSPRSLPLGLQLVVYSVMCSPIADIPLNLLFQ